MTRPLGITLVLMLLLGLTAMSDEFPTLVGPYLGQRLPGTTPQLFAFGIVSVREDFEHSAAVFSPDRTEAYWCTTVNWYTDIPGERVSRLYTTKVVDGVWTQPVVASFTQQIPVGIQRPRFSPDGDRLYFESHRNLQSEHTDTDIYVVERKGAAWSDPASLSDAINSSSYERLHCVTSDGSLIFTRDLVTAREKVYISRLVDGKFTEAEPPGEPFDSQGTEFAIALASDESYVLIDLDRAVGPDELFISYKKPDGRWTDRIRTPYNCGGLMVLSPDGEYLFFHGEGIYWVDTSFVENLKPVELR